MNETYRLVISAGNDGELHVEGEVDAYTAPQLEAALGDPDQVGTGPQVRLNLGSVTFMDSTGIRVIVRFDNDLRADGRQLVLVAPSPAVARLLQLTALDEKLTIEPGAQ